MSKEPVLKESAERVQEYFENEGLQETLNHCYAELNNLGLYDHIHAYIHSEAVLRTEIIKAIKTYAIHNQSK